MTPFSSSPTQTLFYNDFGSQKACSWCNSWWILNRLLIFLLIIWIVFNTATLQTIQNKNKKVSNRFKIRQLFASAASLSELRSSAQKIVCSYSYMLLVNFLLYQYTNAYIYFGSRIHDILKWYRSNTVYFEFLNNEDFQLSNFFKMGTFSY